MNLMKKLLVCTISFLLTAQPLFANISSKNSRNEQKSFFNNGQIVEGAYYDDSDLVIWVQDLHMNAGVQKNIATLIEEIADKKNIDRIYTEGAAKGKIDISVLESIPKEKNKEHTIEYLFQRGFLSAGEYLAIEKGFDIFGIEDLDLYVKNLKILEDILIANKEQEHQVTEIKENTDKILSLYLSQNILKFKKEFNKDQNETILKYFDEINPLITYYPNLLKYTKYNLGNKQYSISDIEKELLSCLEALKEYISFDRYSSLVNALSQNNQSSLSILNYTINKYAPDLFQQYPNLALFLENQKLLDSINKIELLNEEQLFIKDILSLKSNTAIDLELLELKKAVDILDGYFNASITSIDYALLKSEKAKYEKLFTKYFDGQIRDYSIALLNNEKLSSFYENNILRDKVFSEELIEENEKELSGPGGYEEVCANFRNFKNVKVLIAGGFHYGIIDELKASNTSYLIVMPEINSLSVDEYNYNDFIVYGAQTLNKLFNADFNFGSPTQVINGFFSVIAGWGFLYENSKDFHKDISDWIDNCEKLEGINIDISDIENGFKVNINYKGEEQEKDILFDKKDEPIALGKRVSRLIRGMFSGTKLAQYTTAQMLALSFRGIDNEYAEEFLKNSEKDQRQLLKWITKLAKKRLGKKTKVFVSRNPALIADKRDWALATLTHEGGNFVLYLHDSLFTDALFANLPEGYTEKQFFSQLLRHEEKEFYAINMPESEIGKEFRKFLDDIEGSPSSYNFHRYLYEQNIDNDIFKIASGVVKSVLFNRTYQSMYDMPLNNPKKALIAMGAEDFDFTLPELKEKKTPEKRKLDKDMLLLSPQDCEPVLNEKGLLITTKAAAYYRAVEAIIESLGDRIDRVEALSVMADTYEAAWVKTAVLKKLSEGQKIVKTNIKVPGQLTWSDAVIEDSDGKRTFIHTNHIFFHEATVESKVEEGLRRFGRGSIKKAIELLNETQKAYTKAEGKESSDIKEALEALDDDSLNTSEKKVKAVRAIRRYISSIKKPLESRGLISRAADAAQELRKDYLEYMIEHLNSAEATLQYGKVDKHIIVIDTRGLEGIKSALKKRMEELNEEYSDNGRFEFKFADEIVDIPKTNEEIIKDLNELSSENVDNFTYENPEGSDNNIARILYGTVYSRYVGLLLELKSIAEMSDIGYDVLKSGYEVQDESGKYITELDLIVKDKEGKISIVECKSARSAMSFSKLLKSKVIYKLDTYLEYKDLINEKIGENQEFQEVIFIMDVGSKHKLIGKLEAESKRLSKIYGFTVKFIFLESNPNSVREFLDKAPKPLSLLDPFMKTRAQKLLAAMVAPIWEAILWTPALYMLSVGMFTPAIIFVAATTAFSLLHNLFIWIAAKSQSQPYTFKSFISDFFQYMSESFILSFATFGGYAFSMLATANPVFSAFAAMSSNIITHYIIQSLTLKKPGAKTDSYFSKLRDKYFGDQDSLNMVEALREAENGRLEEKEMKTFLKPPVGAYIVDENGNEGRGFNKRGSLLHAEYFSILNYLKNYIDINEINENGTYTEKGKMFSEMLEAILLNAETINSRIFENNPEFMIIAGQDDINYPEVRTIDDVFNETNIIFRFINEELGDPLGKASLYCTLAPCNKCSKMMAFVKIKDLTYASPSINKTHKGTITLETAGIPVKGKVLEEEAEEYIANYKIANKSPGRTRIASFLQDTERRIVSIKNSLLKENSLKDMGSLYKSPAAIARIAYENSLGNKPNDIIIRTVDNADNYSSSKQSLKNYYANGVIPVTFTRYENTDINSMSDDFLPIMTVANTEGESVFRVYINVSEEGIDFFVRVTEFSGIDIDQAYAMAYSQLIKEFKEGILNPSENRYMNAALNTQNIDIIAVESDLGLDGNRVLSAQSDNIYAMKDQYWAETTDAAKKYKLFSEIQKGADELRKNFRETETIETRPFLTGSSIGINIASLSTDRMPGKINDINSFISIIAKDTDFKALNISGYLPFYTNNDWLDNSFINWAYEAELEGYMDISIEVSNFYEEKFASGQNLLNKEALDQAKDFELNIAKKIYARKQSVDINTISDNDLNKYISDIKINRIQEIIANAKTQSLSISADYVYDENISYEENIENVKEILKIFDGITIEINHDNALNFAGSIFHLVKGKSVIFKTKEENAEKKTDLDIKLKDKFGFRLMRDFIPSENSYGKVISIPVDSVNEKVMENLNNSSAVIVELPEVSENIIEQISSIKNGTSVLSKLIQSAKGLNLKSIEKSLQDHYLYGVDIVNKATSLSAKNILNDALFKDIEFSGIKGRGILVLLQILDRADFEIEKMPAMFEQLKIIVSGAESREAEKINLIIDKLARQFDSSDIERKEYTKEMFKHFIYGLYYESEILSLPAFDKYEGEYILRAGNYAADIRKYLYNESAGMRIDDTNISASLKSLYSLVASDMIDVKELHSLLNYYSSSINANDINNIFLLNAVIGQAAYKYNKADFKKYSDIFREQVISYKTSSDDKWLHIAAMASIAYIEDDRSIKRLIENNFKEAAVFNEYSTEEMIMAISLFELLGYGSESIIFNISDTDALQQINDNYEIVGLYAKLMKYTSGHLTADQISKKLQSTIDNLSIEPVKRYVKTESKVKSASIAMALSEMSEFMGLKIDKNNFEKVLKQPATLAIRSILSAA